MTVGIGFIVAGMLSDLLSGKDLPARLAGYATLAAVYLLTLRLAYWPRVARHARTLTVSYLLVLTAVVFYLLALSPTDLDVFTAPITCVMIGSTLFFPWGTVGQAVVSGFTALGYEVLLGSQHAFTGQRAANITVSLGVSAALSVVGAFVLERSRWTAFAERRRVRALAVQRRHLIEIGRDLRSTLDLDAIVARLVEHARRLIPADAVLLALYAPSGRTYLVAAGSGEPLFQGLVDLAWSDGFTARFCAAFAPAEVRECPGSPLDELFMSLLGQLGVHRVLTAAVGPHPTPAAFLGWLRRAPEPFTPGQRLAAQGIADQAFTALSAARLYQRVEQASRLKSEFVSTMSHELRTPLNVIIGYNQILREALPPEPEIEHALDAVRRSSLELLDLIQATLDLGRLEAGRECVREEPVAVCELFDELAREFVPVPRAPGVALSWDPGDIGTLPTDRQKLKTVLKNLVSNALKFTSAGSVRVDCQAIDGGCRFRVADTGIGIRPEDQKVVFEMFRQADSSDTRRYGGTGLGLYIVRQLVNLLGGHIALESTPGRGSTFIVTIPEGRACAAA